MKNIVKSDILYLGENRNLCRKDEKERRLF